MDFMMLDIKLFCWLVEWFKLEVLIELTKLTGYELSSGLITDYMG